MIKEKHIIGDKKCPACCCGGGIHIDNNCGGNWHERLIDDTEEDGFIHNYKCDKCFKDDYHYGYEDMKIEFEG